MKVLIRHLKEKGLAPETMLRTQRNRPFPKAEKSLISVILAKGGPHENFLKALILQIAEGDIIYVKLGADEDGAMDK